MSSTISSAMFESKITLLKGRGFFDWTFSQSFHHLLKAYMLVWPWSLLNANSIASSQRPFKSLRFQGPKQDIVMVSILLGFLSCPTKIGFPTSWKKVILIPLRRNEWKPMANVRLFLISCYVVRFDHPTRRTVRTFSFDWKIVENFCYITFFN